MANLIENIDFNGDGAFTGSDLDISWAYLQVKKRYEDEVAANGAMTITEQNFNSEVNKQYLLNKTGTIAESNDKVALRTPGFLSSGAKAPKKRINFKKLWRFNTPFLGNNAYESIDGNSTGNTLSEAPWTTSNSVDTPVFKIEKKGIVSLDDQGDLRSDRNWTFYMKGAIKNIHGTAQHLFRKGNFSISVQYTQNKILSKIEGSDGHKNFLVVPFTKDELNYKDFEASVVREGMSIRMFINGVECFKDIPGDMPDPIIGGDKREPIVFKGPLWTRLDVVYITELDFIGGDVLDVQGNYSGDIPSYLFAHDMDIENSFFASKQMFPDKFGSFAKVINAKYGPSAAAQTHWVTPPTADLTNGYIAKDTCLGLTQIGTRANQTLSNLPTVDFAKDFTISFWVLFDSMSKFFTMTCQDGTKVTLQFHWKKTTADAIRLKVGNVDKSFPIDGLGSGAGNRWQHITLIKNGNYFSLWGNKKYNDGWTYHSIGDAEQTKMAETKIEFSSTGKGTSLRKLYLSHLRILGYAVSQIPKGKKGMMSSWPFIDKLMEPIEPGQV